MRLQLARVPELLLVQGVSVSYTTLREFVREAGLGQQHSGATIAGLEAAWRFFGGIPKRLILDNFPAAVAGPDALEPRLTRGFLEYSQVRGFIADPARVRRPKAEPHVERSIQYVRERFFKG